MSHPFKMVFRISTLSQLINMGLVTSQIDDDDFLRPEEYEELETMSGFTRDEIRKLYRRYKTLDRAGNGHLGEDDLLRVPEVAMNPMVDRVLGYFGFGLHANQLADTEHTRINFADFVRALSLFNQAKLKEEKLEHVFRAFDLDGNGVISRDELCGLLRSLVGRDMKEEDVGALVEQALTEADHDGDEGLNFKEFCDVLKNTDVDKTLSAKTKTETSLDAFHRKRERELKVR